MEWRGSLNIRVRPSTLCVSWRPTKSCVASRDLACLALGLWRPHSRAKSACEFQVHPRKLPVNGILAGGSSCRRGAGGSGAGRDELDVVEHDVVEHERGVLDVEEVEEVWSVAMSSREVWSSCREGVVVDVGGGA